MKISWKKSLNNGCLLFYVGRIHAVSTSKNISILIQAIFQQSLFGFSLHVALNWVDTSISCHQILKTQASAQVFYGETSFVPGSSDFSRILSNRTGLFESVANTNRWRKCADDSNTMGGGMMKRKDQGHFGLYTFNRFIHRSTILS